MDGESIERIRTPGFTIGRRGYSQREVDNYLSELADWLETSAAEELGSVAVKHKLELAGRTTSQILLTTEQECEDMRNLAEAEATEMVESATRAARETRRVADEETTAQRVEADRDAERTVMDARIVAKQTVEQAEAKRAEIEAAARDTRAAADVYSGETRAAADDYAADTHRTADDYAAGTRRTADEDAAETARQAAAKAHRTVKEGEDRRKALETLIADLRAGRDDALAALEDLAKDVAGIAAARRPPKGGDPFAKPKVLDPQDREGSAGSSARVRAGT